MIRVDPIRDPDLVDQDRDKSIQTTEQSVVKEALSRRFSILQIKGQNNGLFHT